MRVSIGILAHNEERDIGKAIRSLLSQSLFLAPPEELEHVEVVCVPNGCTDDTPKAAAEAFAAESARLDDPRVALRVETLAAPGKSNAWNEYVHRFADPCADYLVFMDADVVFVQTESVVNMINALRENADAVVSTGLPMKHLHFMRRKGPLDWLSLQVSRCYQESRPGAICGQIFCIRGSVARDIWMPIGLLMDDAFLRAMVVTDQFRSSDQPERVIRAPDAAIVFEAYTALAEILRHERRLMIGLAMNAAVYDYLWRETDETGAGCLVRRNNEQDSEWAQRLFPNHLSGNKKRPLPARLVLRHLRSLKRIPVSRWFLHLPVASLRVALDLVVWVNANRALARRQPSELWW